jgi:iron(III) transport system substrate-binding protein
MRSLVFILSLFLPLSAWADMEQFVAPLNQLPAAERHQKLIEGAKKEGEVMLYSSTGLEEIRAINKLFGKKYPFLNVRFLKKGGGQLFNVVQMEIRGRQYIVDVFWAGMSTLGPIYALERKSLARYISPERAGIPDEYMDKEGYWTATRISVASFVYHTMKVPPDKVPRTYLDLLDPFWKGKLSVDSSRARFPRLLVERMGWEGAEAYFKKLAQQDLGLYRGRTARMQLILAGENVGSLDINADNVVEMKRKGAPLDYAIMDPSLLSLTSVGMPQKPPHPHAAVLLYDFIISKEGQEELAREKNVPVREGVGILDKELAQRLKEGRAQKKFIIQSPATYDPPVEERYNRLYMDILVRKTR